MMFIATLRNCLSSIIFVVSKANEDMVVKDPQNPTATSKEYFESKFKDVERAENIPKMKLPIMLINSTFEVSEPNTGVEDAIL